MGIFDKLFSRKEKAPTVTDLKVKLREVTKDQMRNRRELERIEKQKSDRINQAKKAKKEGKDELVRDMFRELRQVEIDKTALNRDLRQNSLEKMALNRFVRKMERLEKMKDKEGIKSLLMRVQSSGLEAKINEADVKDEDFNDYLSDIFEDEEIEMMEAKEVEDRGFAEFDKVLEDMISAESGETTEELDDIEVYKEDIDKALKNEPSSDT